MIRATYTGRDGLPYFFPVLDDEQDDAQSNMAGLPGSIAGPQADMTLARSRDLSDREQTRFWPEQDNFVSAGRVDDMDDRDDPLLLRASSQSGLPFNRWQRSEVPQSGLESDSWEQADDKGYGKLIDPALYVNEQSQGGAATTGYPSTFADALQGRKKNLDLPPPGLTREQEATWMQRQLFQNWLGIDTKLLPNVDYAEFTRKGSKHNAQVPPVLLRTIRGSMAHAITNSLEPKPGSVGEWFGPQLQNLQNFNIADNVLSAKAALKCLGTIPDCDLVVKQLNLVNGKDDGYGMNIDFHLAQKDEPVAFNVNVMDDDAFTKIVAANSRLPKNTGGYWNHEDQTMYLPRGRNFTVTEHEFLHAMGRGHDAFNYRDIQNRPGVMSYATDFIRSTRPTKRDYKILVDNYRDYPARTPSIWDFFGRK